MPQEINTHWVCMCVFTQSCNTRNHQENEGSYSLNHTYFHDYTQDASYLLSWLFFSVHMRQIDILDWILQIQGGLEVKNSPLVFYSKKNESLKLHLKQRWFFSWLKQTERLTAGLWSETGCDLIVFEAVSLLLCREGCWVRQAWWPTVHMVLCSSHTGKMLLW